jgi:hypothetical protein
VGNEAAIRFRILLLAVASRHCSAINPSFSISINKPINSWTIGISHWALVSVTLSPSSIHFNALTAGRILTARTIKRSGLLPFWKFRRLFRRSRQFAPLSGQTPKNENEPRNEERRFQIKTLPKIPAFLKCG